jgi:hypothetical protein
MKPDKHPGASCIGSTNGFPIQANAGRALLFILLIAVWLAAASASAAASDKPARFMLFNAEYNSSLKQLSKTTVFLEKRLFKLDTHTGETWVLIDVLQDGKDIRYWKKITEVPD